MDRADKLLELSNDQEINIDEIYEDSEIKAVREQRLEDLDPDYIIQTLKDHLEWPLDVGIDNAYLKGILNKTKSLREDGDDTGVNDVIDQMYETMIDMISVEFGLDFNSDGLSNKKALKHLYRFFVIDLAENLASFMVEIRSTIQKN